MANYTDLVQNIENKAAQLIAKKNEVERENEQVKVLNSNLNEKVVALEKEIEDLKGKNKILRIAKGANEDGSSRDVKLKINEIVREVDKCIAQLNE